MGAPIKFTHEAFDSELVFRAPRWPDFAVWWDSISRALASDAAQNLVAMCAVSPPAGELAAAFEDGLGFLPPAIADKLLDHVGAPAEGFGKRYPALAPDQVPADMLAAAKKATKRPIFVRVPSGVWALRAPGTSAAGAYTDAIAAWTARSADASFAGAARSLVLACVISPDAATAAQQIDEHPHIAYSLVDTLRDSGGGKALRGV